MKTPPRRWLHCNEVSFQGWGSGPFELRADLPVTPPERCHGNTRDSSGDHQRGTGEFWVRVDEALEGGARCFDLLRRREEAEEATHAHEWADPVPAVLNEVVAEGQRMAHGGAVSLPELVGTLHRLRGDLFAAFLQRHCTSTHFGAPNSLDMCLTRLRNIIT